MNSYVWGKVVALRSEFRVTLSEDRQYSNSATEFSI